MMRGGKLIMIVPMMTQKRFFGVFLLSVLACGGGVNE